MSKNSTRKMCLIVMSNDVRCSKMPLFRRIFGASEGVHIQEVTGSSPVVPTTQTDPFLRVRFLFLRGGDERDVSPVGHATHAATLHAIGRTGLSFRRAYLANDR